MNWDQNKELVEQILRTGMYAKLYGVKFLLYDEDRNPIGEFTSDDDGYVYITADDLPDGANTSGRFYLRELEAAEGYILDKEYKTVYVRPGRTAEIEWVNEAITGQIQIYKYAAEANSVTGVPAGTPLQGAVYEIINERSGRVVDYYNTDYGDITFSDAETPVVYYNQTDSRWGNKMYGKSGTIGEAGCGPTALAIAVASLTSNQVTPYDVAQWSVENGYRCEGNGSYHSLIPNGGAHYGLTVTGVGNDSKRLVDALKNGKLVIAIMSKGHFTSSGHFIVLRGVTEGGKILVADPASVKRSNQEWELGIILNEASRRAGSGGPFWVMSA